MGKLSKAEQAYTFDDFVLTPQYSKIASRKDPDVSINIGGLNLDIPIVASPMNTITESDMILSMYNAGGIGVLHRYMSIPSQIHQVNIVKDKLPLNNSSPNFYVAVGVNGDMKERVSELSKNGVRGFCIDVANGHNENCIAAVRYIRERCNDASIMAGNVSTCDGAYRLSEAGANSIRVGIGPGCFAAGSRVLMSNGTYKNIEDVRKGDYVINKNGQKVMVKRAFSTGIKKVMSYKNSAFYMNTICTYDHRHWVAQTNNLSCLFFHGRNYKKMLEAGKVKVDWVEAKKLKRNKLLLPSNIQFDLPAKINVPLSELKPIPYHIGYIFGLFLARGRIMRRRKHVSWLLNNNKTDVVEKLNNSLYKVFKNGISVTIGSSKTKKYIEYRLYNSVLADFLESFGSGPDMHLPADLLCSHKKYLLGLYNGLLDNGDLPYVHFNKHTSELFGVVNYLLYGYFPTVCDKKHKKMPIIRSESRITKEYQITDVTDIEHSSDAVIVYDLEVDDSTHSFIVNNAIVHNSLCSTRVVTGHGLPQLSVIEDCVRIKDMFPNVAIIADGGIRSSGDIIKAYAIGADAVMVGSMLSGTEETPGDWLEADGKLYKYYNGMASTAARSKWKGQSTGVPEEGISTKVLFTGKLAFQVVIGLAEAVKAGMTFSNARSLEELRRNAKWRRISAAGYIEGTPHRKREL